MKTEDIKLILKIVVKYEDENYSSFDKKEKKEVCNIIKMLECEFETKNNIHKMTEYFKRIEKKNTLNEYSLGCVSVLNVINNISDDLLKEIDNNNKFYDDLEHYKVETKKDFEKRKDKCIYCDNKNQELEFKEKATHFVCGVCGCGMCDDCYNTDKEHDEHMFDFHETIEDKELYDLIKKKSGVDYGYLCYKCCGDIEKKRGC